MRARPAVTLQINVAPTDLPHAVHTLPHQLRQLGGQVDEVLFAFDLHRTARGGRFGEAWDERRAPMEELLYEICSAHPHARVVVVDYDDDAVRRVSAPYLGEQTMPAKDTKGAPFYPYFFALEAAGHDVVLHLDSDLMFGGGSQSWVDEACALLAEHDDVITCSPLPGPPTADGELRTQSPRRFAHPSPAFSFPTLSTRVFLLDRRRLRALAPLQLRGPLRAISTIKARLHGNPPYRAAESAISEAMRDAGLSRVDFLGREPGLWSLHPPFRSPEFYAGLPQLIARIEAGDVPDAQRGDYDVNDSMVDWRTARRRARWRRVWA